MDEKICPICKRPSDRDENFCGFCRYPLNVKKITEYGPGDIKTFLTHLQTVLRPYASIKFNDDFLDQAYHELFSLDWLRPETAVTNFAFMRGMHAARGYFEYPTLDLGCGAGVFLSIFFGAKLYPRFDDYGSVDLEKTDIYNSYQGAYKNCLAQKPSPIGYGIDIKENSVKNAADLGAYDEVKAGDVRKLPFASGSMNTVFSNMVDDIRAEDLPAVFGEARRVLKDGKYFIFVTPAEDYRSGLYYYPLARQKSEAGEAKEAELFLQYDRGRSEWEPRSKEFWKDFLTRQSFKMVSYAPCLDGDALKFWDVGFRPFFPELLKLRKAVFEKNYLIEFKTLALEILKNYFFPVANRPLGPDATFAVVVAQKN